MTLGEYLIRIRFFCQLVHVVFVYLPISLCACMYVYRYVCISVFICVVFFFEIFCYNSFVAGQFCTHGVFRGWLVELNHDVEGMHLKTCYSARPFRSGESENILSSLKIYFFKRQ